MSRLLKVVSRRHRSTGWNPAQLPELRGWWRPNMLGYADGTPVTSLASMAGPANTLDSPDAARTPAYATVSAKGALVFDGVNDSMLMSDKTIIDGAPAVTFFALLKHDTIPVAGTPLIMGVTGLTPTSTRALICLHNTAGSSKVWRLTVKDTDVSATMNILSAVNADLLTHVVVATMVRAAGNLHSELWLDGIRIINNDQAFGQPTWPTAPGAGGFVGNRDPTSTAMIGKVVQAGMTRAGLSTLDRQKLEGYLAWFGGIQAQLPPDHPYFSVPPMLAPGL